jgi:polysaccharide export outer membrane protein
LSARRTLRRFAWTLGLACLTPAWARAQAPAPASAAPSGLAHAPAEYKIGSGDVLQVFVWREPELSRDVTVRVDGKITVPLLGDVDAINRTPRQLATELATLYAKFLSSPQVTVGIAQANSSRFYVIGQVMKPGDFPLSGRLTVLQGLALAGGLKEFAKADSIVILRRDPGGESAVQVNYKRLEAGRELQQNVELKPGDTVVVP